jgi:predicted amidohydrolase
MAIRPRVEGARVSAGRGYRGRPAPIRAHLERASCPQVPAARADRVRVGLAQWHFTLHSAPLTYAEQARRLTTAAVRAGAQLVVFPEDVGTPLLGMLPGLPALPAHAETAPAGDDPLTGLDRLVGEVLPGRRLLDLFRMVAPGAWPVYHTTFSTLAASTGAYILAGSILLPDRRGRVRNVAHLYGPDGRLLGRQVKTHLMPYESAWGLVPGTRLRGWDVLGTRLAVPICMDLTYWEPVRLAVHGGAELLVSPAANTGAYNAALERRGGWGRVQETPAYALFAAMTGNLGPLLFRARSAVYAPLELTPRRDGIVAQARTAHRQEVVIADCDLAALRRFKAARPAAPNPALYLRYLPHLYGGLAL